MASLLTGMSLTFGITHRLEAYFEYYRRLPNRSTTDNFERALIEVYAHVLHFVATAIQTYQSGRLSRTWEAMWNTSAIEDFEQEWDKLGTRVEIEANNCDRGLEAQDREDMKQWKANLDQTLQKLDEIQELRETIKTLHIKADLSKLESIAGAKHNSYEDRDQPQCLPGTRTEILDQITKWVDDPTGRSIFWLCGKAGTGKSTISRTVAYSLEERDRLGASFFFKRGEGDRGTAKRFFPTIVRQLLDKIPEASPSVARQLDADSFLCNGRLQEQFDKLLVEPFKDLTLHRSRGQQFIILVDALDECEQGNDIRTILKLLAGVNSLGPHRLRILVTSRPELPIQLGFKTMSGDLHKDVRLEEAQLPSIEQDIRAFFQQKFKEIKDERQLKRPFDPLPVDWPTEEELQKLVSLAVPLFIFASTIYRFVAESSPRERLESILKQQNDFAYSGLEKTYSPILNQLIAETDRRSHHQIITSFKKIVGPIVLIADSLSVTSLSSLLQLNQAVIYDQLESLHSVLDIPSDLQRPVRLLHLSFRDFLIDSERKEDKFWIDEKQTHGKLARLCLQLLSQSGVLKRDLCGVKEPGARRSDIQWRFTAGLIPPDVAYACRYWVWHLLESQEKLVDNNYVHLFLQKHFLHWLEALSWLGQLSNAIGFLSKMKSRVQVCSIVNKKLKALIFIALLANASHTIRNVLGGCATFPAPK